MVVWYYDGQPSDDTYLGGRVIASLAVNESNVTQFYWNATAGNHTICVLVDPENLTVEENESNTSVICCVRPIKIILIKKNERIGGSDKRYGGRENGKQYKYGFSN